MNDATRSGGGALGRDGGGEAVIVNPHMPFEISKDYRQLLLRSATHQNLVYWAGEFYRYAGSGYRRLCHEDLRADVYHFLAACRVATNWKELISVAVTPRLVDAVIDGLRATCKLRDGVRPPVWLCDATWRCGDCGHGETLQPCSFRNRLFPPSEFLLVGNGPLHLPTRELWLPDHRLFAIDALDLSFDSTAKAARWLAFLQELWPYDPASIDTLAEIFGCVLVGDLRYQKIFCLVGPPRAGKGVIARVLTALIGIRNTCFPTLQQLAGLNHDHEILIGKALAVISDARLGRAADAASILETMLRISGGDSISVNRKHIRQPWEGTLDVQFVLLGNELPVLPDASGGLRARLVILRLVESFLGRENLNLTAQLITELPGIVNWSLDGYERLTARGRFEQPSSAANLAADYTLRTAPVHAFFHECCDVQPAGKVEVGDLFARFGDWCAAHGRQNNHTEESFGRDLRLAYPQVEITRPRRRGAPRCRMYKGFSMKKDR